MNDQQLKKILSEALRNRGAIIAFLNSQKAEEIAKGNVFLDEEFLNGALYDALCALASPHLRGYRINLREGKIVIAADVQLKQFGEVSLLYELAVVDFVFRPGVHKLTFSYREQVEPMGNPLQITMFRAMGFHKHFLKTALGFAKVDYVKAAADFVSIDLGRSPFSSKLPKRLFLSYKGCQAGALHLSFALED